MSTRKAICFVAGVTCLYAILIIVGGALAGAGHGSAYFGTVILAPFSAFGDEIWVGLVGIAFWMLVGLLIALRRFVWCRFAAGTVLVAHYFGVVFMSLQREDWYFVDRVWRAAWIIVVPLVGLYVVSQGLMWVLITRRQRDA